ncbi:MAG TPA: OB-fold nucleic acid binding domain-containing protein, partial [Polyangiaceae bacterium]|nr:OB-fold nucleic acid binding domain-containing protein [Polyangiaceae bacterium]
MPDEPKVHASSEEAIIDARRAKGALARERGESPFANDVHPHLGARTLDIAGARALVDAAKDEAGRYDEGRVQAVAGEALVHVRGRVTAFRSTGGLSFLRLRDRTGEIQLLVS